MLVGFTSFYKVPYCPAYEEYKRKEEEKRAAEAKLAEDIKRSDAISEIEMQDVSKLQMYGRVRR